MDIESRLRGLRDAIKDQHVDNVPIVTCGEIRDALETIEGLEEDLKSAVTIAWKYGAKDWVQMNYPRLAASLDKYTQS